MLPRKKIIRQNFEKCLDDFSRCHNLDVVAPAEGIEAFLKHLTTNPFSW
jgi:hypothetical protein